MRVVTDKDRLEEELNRIVGRRINLLQIQIDEKNLLLKTAQGPEAEVLRKDIAHCTEEIEKFKTMPARESLMYILRRNIMLEDAAVRAETEGIPSGSELEGMHEYDLKTLRYHAKTRSSEHGFYGKEGVTLENLERQTDSYLLRLLNNDYSLQIIDRKKALLGSLSSSLGLLVDKKSPEALNNLAQLRKRKIMSLKVKLKFEEKSIKEFETLLSDTKRRGKKKLATSSEVLLVEKSEAEKRRAEFESELSQWQTMSDQDILEILITKHSEEIFEAHERFCEDGGIPSEEEKDRMYHLFSYMHRGFIGGEQRVEQSLIHEMSKREKLEIGKEVPQYLHAYTCFSVAEALGLQADLEVGGFYGDTVLHKENCPNYGTVETIMSLPEEKQEEFYEALQEYANGKSKKDKFYKKVFGTVIQSGVIVQSATLVANVVFIAMKDSFPEILNNIYLAGYLASVAGLTGAAIRKYLIPENVEKVVTETLEKMEKQKTTESGGEE